MTTEKTEPAARGVNEWLTPELAWDAVRAFHGHGQGLLENATDALRAALPPLVLASEAEQLKRERDATTVLFRNAAKDRDTLRARVAELETMLAERSKRVETLEESIRDTPNVASLADMREHQQGAARRVWLHARKLLADIEAQRPQPSAPNAGEALTDDECVAVAQAMYGQVAVPMSASGKAKIHRAFAKICALRPSPSPSAEAGLTDAQVREVVAAWFDSEDLIEESDIRDMRRAIARLDTLRPQPARLRMPTVGETSRLQSRCEAAMRSGQGYAQGHAEILAFLRTLGAEIVEGGATPAPAREPEPDYWTKVKIAHASMTHAGTEGMTLDEAWSEADDFVTEARRRVKGEEAGT